MYISLTSLSNTLHNDPLHGDHLIGISLYIGRISTYWKYKPSIEGLMVALQLAAYATATVVVAAADVVAAVMEVVAVAVIALPAAVAAEVDKGGATGEVRD